jgi:hypothetical protein
MRRPVITLTALTLAAVCLSSCGAGGETSQPSAASPSESVRIYHAGDQEISIILDVFGQGRADISYALHTGDTPTKLTVTAPWTKTVQAAVNEPGLSPTLTARNTDPKATIGCRITTSQLAITEDNPPEAPAVATCATKIRH